MKIMKIMVFDNRLNKSIRVILGLFLFVMFPISLGVFLNSWAFQTIGFIFSMIMLFSYSVKKSNEVAFSTPEEAIKYLETLK